MNGTRLLLRNPISKTDATGLSFQQRLFVPPCHRTLWFGSFLYSFLRLPHGTPSKECLR